MTDKLNQQVLSRIKEVEQGLTKNLLLRNMGLQQVPAEVFSLQQLTGLNLENHEDPNEVDRNQIEQLPKEIGQLQNLILLDLSGNKLRQLPEEVARLKRLVFLDLRGNPLERYPTFLSRMPHLSTVLIDDDVPGVPVEVSGRGTLREYIQALDEQGETELFESKLIFLGQGGVGKTTLVECLTNPYYYMQPGDFQTTEGIDVRPWTFPIPGTQQQFTANIWDFGGQEIYSTTHQFFLTKRSLYVFVWDARVNEKEEDLFYWLNTIKLLSNGSPVILVMNKMDERTKELNEMDLKANYPNILGFYKVSCADGTNVNQLRAVIQQALQQLQHVGSKWPNSWLSIRRDLEGLSKDYISYQEYAHICQRHGVEEGQRDIVAQYLHDLGIILHFQEDRLLRDTLILKPEWGTDAVYRLLDDRRVIEDRGHFSFEHARQIWQDYPADKHPQLLQLMLKFELCFPLEGEQAYIIPQLLAATRPDSELMRAWDERSCGQMLRFEMRYDFLPKGVMTRFICRNYDFICQQHFWKDGVLLDYQGTQALVSLQPMRRKVDVRIHGPQAREVLFFIRNHFAQIHRSLNNPRCKEMIPGICSDCQSGRASGYFDYERLLRFKHKGLAQSQCGECGDSFAIDDIIDGSIRESQEKRLHETLEVLEEYRAALEQMRDSMTLQEEAHVQHMERLSKDVVALQLQSSKRYEQELDQWLGSALAGALSTDTRQQLLAAYNLQYNLHKDGVADDASIEVLLLCLSVETELKRKLFHPFLQWLQSDPERLQACREAEADNTHASAFFQRGAITFGSQAHLLSHAAVGEVDDTLAGQLLQYLQERGQQHLLLLGELMRRQVESHRHGRSLVQLRNDAAHANKDRLTINLLPLMKPRIKEILSLLYR